MGDDESPSPPEDDETSQPAAGPARSARRAGRLVGLSSRYLSVSGGLGFAAVAVGTIGAGAAIPSSHSGMPRAPRGEVAVVVDYRGKQRVAVLSRSAKGWRVLSRIPVKGGLRSVALSPTGRRLAVTTAGGNLSNELRVIDFASGGQHPVVSAKRGDPAAFFGSLAWSPGGRQIAVTRSRSLYGAEIDVVDAAKGSLVRSFRVSARYDSSLAWSRDGARLYFAGQATDRTSPTVRRLVLATGRVSPIDGVRGLDPAVSSDGALSFSADDGIRIVQGGRERKLVGSKRGDRFATWSNEGSVLLVERAAAGCPRYANPACSHVVVLARNGGAPRHLLNESARNPAAR